VVSVGQSLCAYKAAGGFLDIIKGIGAIACNRVHVLDEPIESRTREKENKIRHRLAKAKAVRTAWPKNLILLMFFMSVGYIQHGEFSRRRLGGMFPHQY